MNELSDKNRPQKLEDIFRNKMEEAEMAPSDNLWHRIEHDLDVQEKTYYKKQLVWFQRLAAACVILLLFVGGYVFYDHQLDHKPIVATNVSANETGQAQSYPKPDNTQQNSSGPLLAQENQTAKAKASNQKLKATQSQKNKINPDYPSRQARNSKKQKDGQALEQEPTFLALNDTAARHNVAQVSTAAQGSGFEVQSAFAASETEQNTTLDEGEEVNAILNKEISMLPLLAITNLGNISAPDSLKIMAPVTIVAKPLPETYAAAAPEAEKQKTSRWSFSGKYAPHYFNQHITLSQHNTSVSTPVVNNSLSSTANSSTVNQALEEYDNNIQAGYSFNTEGGAAYKLNQNWALETGLAYTQNIATTTSSYIFSNSQVSARYAQESFAFTDQDINNAALVGVPATALIAAISGTANTNGSNVIQTQPFTTQYRYRLIGIPVKINYQTTIKGKSFYYASMGFLTNLLMQAHILSDSPRVPDLKYAANADSPYRNWQMAAVASVGKGFTLSKNFNLKAGLEASQYLNTLADNPLYLAGRHGKPYTLGIAVSSTYTVGK